MITARLLYEMLVSPDDPTDTGRDLCELGNVLLYRFRLNRLSHECEMPLYVQHS